jgi:hypothetical protein
MRIRERERVGLAAAVYWSKLDAQFPFAHHTKMVEYSG